ncbi:unnamed protein product [Ectocarpus sp. 4 AP-2014]
MATGVAPSPWRALGFWGILTANLGRVAGFLPTSSPPNIKWARHHEHFQHLTQRPSTRGWHASSSSAMAKMRGVPPDDFIDTTAEDEPGSERLAVDFERQELRVIFETMDKNNIFYKMLAEEQIVEILQLTQALLSVKKMPQDISKLCQGDMMKGKWKLDFSTEERYKFLPPTSDVYNYIYDGGGGGRLDNVLRFYKSWAVKSVRAVTNYKMDDRGKISFEFDRIEADLFGFKVPLPNFNADAGFVEVQVSRGHHKTLSQPQLVGPDLLPRTTSPDRGPLA